MLSPQVVPWARIVAIHRPPEEEILSKVKPPGLVAFSRSSNTKTVLAVQGWPNLVVLLHSQHCFLYFKRTLRNQIFIGNIQNAMPLSLQDASFIHRGFGPI
jgi:hypothetical protein